MVAVSFTKDGEVTSLFTTDKRFEEITNIFRFTLFFESLQFILDDETTLPLDFPSVKLFTDSEDIFDINIHKEHTQFKAVLENRTKWYKEFQGVQQERNEYEIKFHNLQREINMIRHDYQLLEIKHEELKHRQEYKTEFFSKVSHELRTPISGILGLSNLLEAAPTDARERDHYIRSLQSSAEHLKSIVNDILDISKMEAGKFELNNQPLDLNSLIEDVIMSFHYQCVQKGLEMRSELVNTLPRWVKGDATRIRQILYNLLNNAFKFTEKGHLLLLVDYKKTRFNRYEVSFTVSDTGIGMSEKVLNKLFMPYQQGSAETSSKYGGTGLGLNVVKQLVELYGGEVNVDSKEGEGSSFTFNLILEAASNPALAVSINVQLLYTDLNILIVEDDPINLLLLSNLFEKKSKSLQCVVSGHEALEIIEDSDIDLLITDRNLPGMRGDEVARTLKQKNKNAVIFMLSGDIVGNDDPLVADEIIDRAFLKPANPKEVFGAVNASFYQNKN